MDKLSRGISKAVGRAICDYRMISAGDRILIGVSGGKDSLCLLQMLRDRQRYAPICFELAAAHYRSSTVNAAVVEDYCRREDFPLIILDPGASSPTLSGKNPCYVCSCERRRQLFAAARTHGFNKLALAHHQDDIIQTVLLNMFYLGEISTMPPKLDLFGGALTLIRPLAYVPEQRIRRFSEFHRLPVLPEKCRFDGKTNRHAMAKLIDSLERTNKDIRKNIFRSLRRIKAGYLT